MKVKSPVSVDGITAGKPYLADKDRDGLLYIVNNYDQRIIIRLKGCAHLYGKKWQVI
jgi:hypothetical protein